MHEPARGSLLAWPIPHGWLYLTRCEMANGPQAMPPPSQGSVQVTPASTWPACESVGLVESRQDWRHVYYRLAVGVTHVLDVNDAFIEQVADRITACQRPEMQQYS